MSYIKDVETYYKESQWLYRLFNYNTSSLGMHFGFWDKDTKDRHQAILNENQAVIDHGKITNKMRVLDAGCGVGGTTIYITDKTKAKVYGITLVPKQVKLAKKYAKRKGVERLTDFSVQDYTKTKFNDEFFDVVYGIESICYSSPKSEFLKEAFRVLKPKGKLIILDGYLNKKPKNRGEKKIIEKFKSSFSLKEFITSKKMRDQIKEAGFKDIKEYDKTEEVKPSVEYYQKLCITLSPIVKVLNIFRFGFTKALGNTYTALVCAGKGIEEDLMAYRLHVSTK